MGAAPAAAASMAGVGLSAYGAIVKSRGEAAGDEFKAENLERKAQVGRVAAAQTDAQMTERIDQTLANSDVIRAAAHSDPTSPTGAAVRDWQEYLGTRDKTIAVDNIMEQVDQDTAGAAYLRSASKYALLGGELEAGADILKGLGGAIGQFTPRGPPGAG